MATYYNPKIITNNIEFSVDAANVKSWSGATSIGTDYGYFGGGGGGTKSWVDRIDFSNDTATASARGPLSQARKYLSATGNINYGYYCGGFPAPYSLVDRIDYSNDTPTAAVKGPLTSSNTYTSAATGNASYGYIGGGRDPGRSIVDRIDYSNDTPTASPKGPLSGTRYSNAATGNASYGYFGGGYGGSPNAVRSIVDRIDYSSDTGTAPAKGPLAQATSTSGATGNTSYGYWAGGSESPSNGSSSQRVDYSSDTSTAVVKGPLNAVRYSTQSSSPREYGIPSTESIWKDMTGKGHDTTVDGATYQGGNNGVWNFDGTNDYISLDATTDIQAQAVDWTWECWFYVDAGASSYDYLFAYGPPHQIAWYDNQLNAWFNDTDNTSSYDVAFASGSNTVPTGQWTHGVISRIGSAWKMYINGVEKASASASFTVANSSTAPKIGSYDGSQYFLDGKIASMRIYKGRGFTASEVQQNFNAVRTRFGV